MCRCRKATRRPRASRPRPARMVERTEPLQASGVVSFDERRTARLGSLVEGVVDELRVQAGRPRGPRRGGRPAAQPRHSRRLGGLLQGAAPSGGAWTPSWPTRARPSRARRPAGGRQGAVAAGTGAGARRRERRHAGGGGGPGRDHPRRAGTGPLRHQGASRRQSAGRGRGARAWRRLPARSSSGWRPKGLPVTPGTPLLVISDLSRVWVIAEIDETLRRPRRHGARGRHQRPRRIPASPSPATLTTVGDVVNPTTRRVTLRIEADNADRRLKPQMFVTVTLGASTPRRVLVVPSRAVQAMEGETGGLRPHRGGPVHAALRHDRAPRSTARSRSSAG